MQALAQEVMPGAGPAFEGLQWR